MIISNYHCELCPRVSTVLISTDVAGMGIDVSDLTMTVCIGELNLSNYVMRVFFLVTNHIWVITYHYLQIL